ncbi:MAG TPA: ABC transporter ATP-binding protein, partial [Thermoanaerobaculia bacterium]|nr:ABC transporter ATP-binding protein [Thermoanaerobaculia bacterium]
MSQTGAVQTAGPQTPPPEARETIELQGLEVRLGGRPVLRGLDASLHGRAVGLLGPNGAGKTTLLHTLLGFHPPAAGTARLFGLDVRRDARAIRGLIGYMPENDAFVAGLSGVRFVRLMAELSGLPSEAALERAHEALFYVGLGEARYRDVGTYSLGMKQLAKLAQALVHGPRLVILDEPTNGLDPPARERMLRLIRDIRDAGEVRLVVSSHLLRDVEEVCDEVLILKDGRVAAVCDLEAERRANRRFLELELRPLGAAAAPAAPDAPEPPAPDTPAAAAAGSDHQAGFAAAVDPRAGFAGAVEKLGCELALAGRQRMKLVLPDGVEVRDLYRVAAEQQVQIRRLDYRRDSLEDLFLQAMESDG